MAEQHPAFRRRATKEIALLSILLFAGLVVMPGAIFLVGEKFFGVYGGHGFSDFFGTLSAKIRSGDIVAWFLVMSPYLAWQILRLTVFGWKVLSRRRN